MPPQPRARQATGLRYKKSATASSMDEPPTARITMSSFDSTKDYYLILGVEQGAALRDIERRYKRLATRHHPDRGGDEEEMKSLNEAYRILRDETTRRQYDSERQSRPTPMASHMPASAPAAQDVGLFGQGLSTFLYLIVGLFLLVLVRSQWIWFLWPLAILAFLVILFGVLMAHSLMLSFNESLPVSHAIRRHMLLQEALFWSVVGGGGYGLYLLFSILG